MGENLAYFCDKDGPGNTSQVPHPVGADSSIFCPDFDDSEGLLKVLNLFSRQFKNHQIVFPAQKWSFAFLVTNWLYKIIGDDSLDISGDSFLIELAKTYVNVSLFVVKGDDRHFGVCHLRQMLYLCHFLESVV